MTSKTRAYDVYLDEKLIDTIFFTSQRKGRGAKLENEEEVRRSLVYHDGYDPSIIVREVATHA